MKAWIRKVKGVLYNKTTFMLIPHSEKGILSVHLSNLNFFISSAVLLVLLFFGVLFTFQIQDKKSDFDYYYQENQYYKKQIENIHIVLPNITQSQKNLSSKLYHLFEILGISYQNEDLSDFKLDEYFTVSSLDNIEAKMENISTYIKNFKKTFSEIPSIFPLVTRKYWFTSPFGQRIHPISGRSEFHPAIDIAAFPYTPIQATADGVVQYASWRGGYGLVVSITHQHGFSTRYAHMARLGVSSGQTVKKGQVIGYVGTTGVSTGYHCHYEVRMNDEPINPMNFITLDRFW